MNSVFGRKGLTFSVEMARQAGKNELSAQLELLLLTLFMAEPQNLVKCSPTFKPQTVISMMRLKDRLNDAGFDGIWVSELGYIIRLGNARAILSIRARRGGLSRSMSISKSTSRRPSRMSSSRSAGS